MRNNNQPPFIRKLLERLELDEREVEVYLTLLSLKAAKASAIARAAKQQRTFTYLILRQLEEKGLVSRVKEGGALRFIAEPPAALLRHAEERTMESQQTQTLVKQALPFLESMTSPLPGRPAVTLFYGLQSMKDIYREAFATDGFVSIYNPVSVLENFGQTVVKTLFGSRWHTYEYRGRDIIPDTPAVRTIVSAKNGYLPDRYRFLATADTFHTDTLIYGDRIAIFAYDEERTSVRIENRHIADTFRTLFEVLWASGKRR